MLTSLRIQNLALVEDLSLELSGGFTVLTGETGAGKSLLVDALSLLVGARADADLVRSGADRAVVEAVVDDDFDAWNNFLAERGLPSEQPLVLRREVGINNRSRSWINGAACSLGDLREAGRIWIRLTSQHDHQSLLSDERHLGLLDETLGIRADLGTEVEAVRGAHARLQARRKSESEREQRLERLAEDITELEHLAPITGEWGQLRARREPMRHAAQLEQAFREAAGTLREAQPGLQTAHRAMVRAAAILQDSQGDVDRLRSILLEMDDLQATAQDQTHRWAREGADGLETLEARLANYEKLARRHHCEPGDLSGHLQCLKDERKALLGSETTLSALEADLASASETYRIRAETLHHLREAQIPKLEKEVHQRLTQLGMAQAVLQARLILTEDPTSSIFQQGRPVRLSPVGFSALSFWIEPNAGEGFRPLAKIASGGELSRLMLALTGAGRSMNEANNMPRTLVLDEVDAGIGGETALAVGASIQELGHSHQVLAVTHLAQVAAQADQHGRLRKSTAAGRTRSELEWLQGDGKIQELARLLSGHPDRPEAQNHARALLASSKLQTPCAKPDRGRVEEP